MFLPLIFAATLAQAPAPAATPTPIPSPPYSLTGVFSAYGVQSNGSPNAALTDISNALLTISTTFGIVRGSVTAGISALPVLGQALTPTNQVGTNTSLYGYVPMWSVSYIPNAHLTLSAGQQEPLIGQENSLTYQNVNLQRGIVWNAEPTFSRGVRLAYTQGKFTGALEYNDGFYSASWRAIEGLVGWAPSANTNVQFAAIVPNANTPGNVTSPIANKSEYDLMLTQTLGKLQLLPYLLWVRSPASGMLAYPRAQTAFGAVVLANYAFNANFGLGVRYETFTNQSEPGDASGNADLVGFGPASQASTFTITPQYKIMPWTFIRAEYSLVNLARFTPGLGFGPAGTIATQARVGIETGVQF